MNNKDMLMINVLMDQDDVDYSSEDFADSRIELRAMGHNLVCMCIYNHTYMIMCIFMYVYVCMYLCI
jgi:hypothetical protein